MKRRQYNEQMSAELPAEEFFQLKKVLTAAGPIVITILPSRKKYWAPNTEMARNRTAARKRINRSMPFPAHWAPNALLFYTGKMFPARYRNGRSSFFTAAGTGPMPQAGYCVVFVPFSNGKPSGKYEIFATGFTGKETIKGPGDAGLSSCGLAQGPDDPVYFRMIHGRIWRVTYGK